MRRSTVLLVLLMASPDQWQATWAPHPQNKGLRIVYTCEGGAPFFASNWFDVDPASGQATIRRIEPPVDSSSCWAAAAIVRGGDDPNQDYTAEYTLVRIR